MQHNVQSPLTATRILSPVTPTLFLLIGLAADPQPVTAGPCYSPDTSVYCTQCPSARCDAACEAYGSYDPCECPDFPCDPPPCTCIPPTDDGATICLDPVETWIGVHGKYIVAFGPDYPGSEPIHVGFVAGDQSPTCFDPRGCWQPTTTEQWVMPVLGGQVEFVLWGSEDEDLWRQLGWDGGWWMDSALAGFQNQVIAVSQFYRAPILQEWDALFHPQPADPPKYICLGAKIRLHLSAYCHEAYLYAGSRFTLYKRCPPDFDIWTEINSGDPLDSLLRSGCQIWAMATSVGSGEISLTGEDSWGRKKDTLVPLRYKILEMDIDLDGLDDSIEDQDPGKYVRLNDDDDNENQVYDHQEAGVSEEDDLVQLSITPRGVDCPYKYCFIFGPRVKIWRTPTKGGVPLVSGEPLAINDHPSVLYIEGVSSGIEPITGQLLIDPTGYGLWGAICQDSVKVNVICLNLEEPDGLPLSPVSSTNPLVDGGYFRFQAPWCFEWQFVHVDNEVVPYHLTQSIWGVVCGATAPDSPYGRKWEVKQGHLTSTTAGSTRFVPDLPAVPNAMKTVDLTLSMDPPMEGFVEERTLEVYRDHLERDYQNFGTGGSCVEGWTVNRYGVTIPMWLWNGHGSSWHLYSGSGSGGEDNISFTDGWTIKKEFTVSHNASGGGTHPDVGALQRGDVIAYYLDRGELMHSQTCTGNGTETYGANNEALPYPGYPSQQTWKWAVSPAGDWANEVWIPSGGVMPVKVKVLARP